MGITPSPAVGSAERLSTAGRQEHGSMCNDAILHPPFEINSLTIPDLQVLGVWWDADTTDRR